MVAHVQVGCEELQVRDYFSKLRSSVRTFLSRLQRSATNKHSPLKSLPSASAPAAAPLRPSASLPDSSQEGEQKDAAEGSLAAQFMGLDRARQTSMERLAELTDDKGGIASSTNAGRFVGPE